MQLLSVAQYALREGISEQAVYKRIHSGKLKIVTEKREVIRIPVEDMGTEVVKAN